MNNINEIGKIKNLEPLISFTHNYEKIKSSLNLFQEDLIIKSKEIEEKEIEWKIFVKIAEDQKKMYAIF
jgi:hypothetical protein